MPKHTPSGSGLSDEQKELFLNAIIETIYALTLINREEIMQKSRGAAEVAMARQLCMYICATSGNMNTVEIGKLFGRDRTTVKHAVDTIEDLRDDDFWLGNRPFEAMKGRKL